MQKNLRLLVMSGFLATLASLTAFAQPAKNPAATNAQPTNQTAAQVSENRSVWIVRASGPPRGGATGEIRGVISIGVASGALFDLEARANSTEGSTGSNAPNQCPELIKRYAVALGFGGDPIGNGHAVAFNFAARSGGKFVYRENGEATERPYPGAVISISNADGDGRPFPPADDFYGHVGIVQLAVFNEASGTGSVTLFDQNWPGGAWKVVTFERRDNVWYGTLVNRPKDRPAQVVNVEGWANPVTGLVTAIPAPLVPTPPYVDDYISNDVISATISASANVRSRPSVQGSNIDRVLAAGEQVRGKWVRGGNPTTRWLRIEAEPASGSGAGQVGYVWDGNVNDGSVNSAASTGDWGPEIVASVPDGGGLFDCETREGAARFVCLQRLGIRGAALEFARALADDENGGIHAEDFRELGKVDLVHQALSFRPWSAPVFVNGKPRIIVASLDFDGFSDRASLSFKQRYPDAVGLAIGIAGHRNLPAGGQRFVVASTLVNGCMACDVIGSAIMFVDFNADGEMISETPMSTMDTQRFGDWEVEARASRAQQFATNFRAASSQVKAAQLQYAMLLNGYNGGPISGENNPQFYDAVREFVGEHCLLSSLTISQSALSPAMDELFRGDTFGSTCAAAVAAVSPPSLQRSVPPMPVALPVSYTQQSALVSSTEARFIFPFRDIVRYQWCNGVASSIEQIRYGARVGVGNEYHFGFELTTSENAYEDCVSGPLSQMMGAGDTSLWRNYSNDAFITIDSLERVTSQASTRVSPSGDALIITLRGKAEIDKLFRGRPSTIKFVRTTPSGDTITQVPVEYTAPAR